MNRLIQTQKDLLEETTNLRKDVLEAVTDKDLAFTLGGTTRTLGELLTEEGTFQLIYINAFKTFKHDWAIKAPQQISTVEGFKAWFTDLDNQLIQALEKLSDEDLAKPIDRGGWSLPLETNFHVYREAVLIFAAKASIYLRAMDKALSKQLQQWIG